jgi:GxxExxY protein
MKVESGMEFDELSGRVIGCALEVHKQLGPGLLESAYERCLSHELLCAGIHHESQKELPIDYKGTKLDCGYRVDLLVDDTLIVELKAVGKLSPVHEAQLLTYMKLANVKTGLLMNFNVARLKDGIKRFVL